MNVSVRLGNVPEDLEGSAYGSGGKIDTIPRANT